LHSGRLVRRDWQSGSWNRFIGTATARGIESMSVSALKQTLEIEGLDSLGLDADQQRYLSILGNAQGPVRLTVMASKLRLDPATVSRSIEDKLSTAT